MDNLQLLPFERNRYYYGKVLTSADFQAEQHYVNAKRWFMNQMIYGQGIVCGLKVTALDSMSIQIDSGVALDGTGREIIVEYAVIKKLSSLEGYDCLKGKKACICLRYREEEVQPVQTIGVQEQASSLEYNHIREGFDLFLLDTNEEKQDGNCQEEGIFLNVPVLEHQDYGIRFLMPANICRGMRVKLSTVIEKYSDTDEELIYSGVLKFPALQTEEGCRQLDIGRRQPVLKKGETVTVDYWFTVSGNETKKAQFLWETKTATAVIAGIVMTLNPLDDLAPLLSENSPEEMVTQKLGQRNLVQQKGVTLEYVRLADICLADVEHAAVIDEIKETEIKRYISLPARENIKKSYLSYFSDIAVKEPEPLHEEALNQFPAVDEDKEKATETWAHGGILEIPLEPKSKKGQVCYSEEIIHGLGPGNVYVAVGRGGDSHMAGRSQTGETTVYGDNSLFLNKGGGDYGIQTAVKVFHDRGSFQAAVKVGGEPNTIVLNLQWIAIKVPDRSEKLSEGRRTEQKIVPDLATVRLLPKERHYVGVTFHGMEPCQLIYELLDEEGGDIGPDGIYTASSRPGIYEVRISCAEQKGICTYVYAVVGGS